MKNLINYYYGLLISEFKKKNEYFAFEIDNKKYEFIPFYGDINNFYKIYLSLINNNKYCHEIIFNKDKQILTPYDNRSYILIRKNICIEKFVDLEEILNYDSIIYGKHDFNWKKLWKDKVDYYEYQMSQLSGKYKNIRKSFDYYIGLTETAIALLNYVDIDKIKYSVSHKRIKQSEKLDQFYNPLNILIDSRIRDFAEYVKINYFNESLDVNNILNYLNLLNLDYTESLLFLARLLYPTYYFDMYDEVIQEKLNEEKLNFYIKKNTYYEAFLKKIYTFIKNKYKIPEIEWLEN